MDTLTNRLRQQLDFIVEIDRLKQICRQSLITGAKRRETDAEHSWHVALMAVLLAEHVTTVQVDVARVVKMLLIHDLVEIDAGDTYCYDEQAVIDQQEREQRAAERVFNLLPADQAGELRQLWEEFDQMATPDAQFAAALDRLQPLLLNFHTGGVSWKQHGVARGQVERRVQPVHKISAALGEVTEEIITAAVKQGYLIDSDHRSSNLVK